MFPRISPIDTMPDSDRPWLVQIWGKGIHYHVPSL